MAEQTSEEKLWAVRIIRFGNSLRITIPRPFRDLFKDCEWAKVMRHEDGILVKPLELRRES